mmetsp:Transcript_41884/g.105280  ORF Transcript_41884/g.105280 Transcript_41884/m.105280 type:complete len:248 (-) Transcript_41884:451-1194(-)
MIFLHSGLVNACTRVCPSRTNPVSVRPSSSLCACSSLSSASFASSACVAYAIVVVSEKSKHDFAMSTAVSVLSPVRTQSLIPMSFTVRMVSGTPSCNLSSTAVMPMNFKFVSMRAATSAILVSLVSSIMLRAAKYSAFHASNSAVSTTRMPTISVRRPCFENVLKSAEASESNGECNKPSITLSAPLVMHQMLPLCLTMTDIRLRSEVKANSWSTVNFRSAVPGPFKTTSEVFPACLRTRLAKLMLH